MKMPFYNNTLIGIINKNKKTKEFRDEPSKLWGRKP
jgi:hypothetical protein